MGNAHVALWHASVRLAQSGRTGSIFVDKKKKTVSPGQTEIMTEDEMREVERENIRKALEMVNWKVYGDDGAAALLQIKPTALVSRMQKMGLEKPGRN